MEQRFSDRSEFESEADEVVCGREPKHFGAVGVWYADFSQITNEEVSDLLDHRAHERHVAAVSKTPSLSENIMQAD